jgi:hypothetical protein
MVVVAAVRLPSFSLSLSLSRSRSLSLSLSLALSRSLSLLFRYACFFDWIQHQPAEVQRLFSMRMKAFMFATLCSVPTAHVDRRTFACFRTFFLQINAERLPRDKHVIKQRPKQQHQQQPQVAQPVQPGAPLNNHIQLVHPQQHQHQQQDPPPVRVRLGAMRVRDRNLAGKDELFRLMVEGEADVRDEAISFYCSLLYAMVAQRRPASSASASGSPQQQAAGGPPPLPSPSSSADGDETKQGGGGGAAVGSPPGGGPDEEDAMLVRDEFEDTILSFVLREVQRCQSPPLSSPGASGGDTNATIGAITPASQERLCRVLDVLREVLRCCTMPDGVTSHDAGPATRLAGLSVRVAHKTEANARGGPELYVIVVVVAVVGAACGLSNVLVESCARVGVSVQRPDMDTMCSVAVNEHPLNCDAQY